MSRRTLANAQALPKRNGKPLLDHIGDAIALGLSPALVRLPFSVIGIDQTCILLAAESYGGKSTLAGFALLNRALPSPAKAFLIEDSPAWFTPSGKAITFTRPLLLRRGARQLLGDELPRFQGPSPAASRKGAINGRVLARARMFSRHPIDAVALLNPGKHSPRLVQIGPERANRRVSDILFKRRCRLPHPSETQKMHQLLDQAHLGTFRLDYDHPSDGVHLLARIQEASRAA